jgi:hypothetical protein
VITNKPRKETKQMNPTKLIAVALCAAACVTMSALADDDFGIESASPVVNVDPANPQPGMVFNAYNYPNWMQKEQLKDSNSKLPTTASLKSGVDKSERFGIEISQGVRAAAVRWEGFIRCKRATTYTFLFQRNYSNWSDGYSVRINGRLAIPAGIGESSCDVDLKVGWNKIEIVCQFDSKDNLNVSYRPKSYIGEPRAIAPKDFFHDENPEDVDPDSF